MPPRTEGKTSPLQTTHADLGARMTLFAGWNMPLSFSGILAEHRAVRAAAGLFDISHMCQLRVSGPGAEAWLNDLFSNDVRRLNPGEGQYTLLLNDHGGILDDALLYRITEQDYLVVANAAQADNDLKWMQAHIVPNIRIDDTTDRSAGIALQGPLASEILVRAFPENKRQPPRNRIFPWESPFGPLLVARTGYTGEDGFEIFSSAEAGPELWKLLMDKGKPLGLLPCGLGARDSLRLEASLPLYGSDLNPSITPFEAGLSAFVCFDKPEKFIGREPLRRQKAAGIPRKLAAFKLEPSAPPPRAHYPVHFKGSQIGEVTSGGPGPSFGCGCGLALIEAVHAQPGTRVDILIRDKPFPATLHKRPLYRRPIS